MRNNFCAPAIVGLPEELRLHDEGVLQLEMGKIDQEESVIKTNLKSYLIVDYIDLSNSDFSTIGESFNK